MSDLLIFTIGMVVGIVIFVFGYWFREDHRG